MGQAFELLKQRLDDIHNLSAAASVLGWDQQTYMPPGGAQARGTQMATLGRISHEILVADETGELLEAAAEEVRDLPPESDESSLVRVAQHDYDVARKIPAALIAEIHVHAANAFAHWQRARQDNDFPLFAPCLQKTIDFSRQIADLVGYEDQRYDALLDQFERGMTTAQVQTLFEELKRELVPLVRAIAEHRDRVDDSILHQPFDEAGQEAFGVMVARAYGYSFDRGRLDRAVHPFETSFSRDDVRITTRYESDFFNVGLFSILHETGHGLYEQGIGESIDGTLLGHGASLGVHESQSRMWENVVGRSRPFWEHYFPQLQQAFPDQLGKVDVETFYRAINKVEPSLIRVEADEVTYNLHIMVRFEMELDLLSGNLQVGDAPAAWNQKMQSYLGIVPPTDSLGILQDVHWSHGIMGYFTTYSLGNILSIQLYDAATKADPEIPEQIGRGEFGSLHGWLEENVYRHGRKFEPNELVQRATGAPIQTGPYLRYLTTKFGEIYAL